MRTVFLLGSKSDLDHANTIVGHLKEWGIESEVIVASAHKVPRKVADIIEKNNQVDDIVYVTIAGRSNALSGVVAANSLHPVIACPPFKDKDDYLVNIHSTLQMPSETPVMTVLDTDNTALSIAKIFSLKDAELKKKVEQRMEKTKLSFEQ